MIYNSSTCRRNVFANWCLTLISAIAAPVVAKAEVFYVAQASLGSASGADAADARPVTFFNAAANWSSPSKQTGKIGPGDTVILVGTISSQLIIEDSGTAGHPIAIQFSPGSALSTPAGFLNGAISAVEVSYITIDGNDLSGTIECTDNGSAPTYGHQSGAIGIYCNQCSNWVIENLVVKNMYVRTNSTDLSEGAANSICIYPTCASGGPFTNFKITGCVLSNAYQGVMTGYENGTGTLEYSYNTIENCNWGIAFGDNRNGAICSGVLVHDNSISHAANWDDSTGADSYHHNFIYSFDVNGGTMSNYSVYDNVVGPGYGVYSTSAIFNEGNSNCLIYNNVCVAGPGDAPDDALVTLQNRNTCAPTYQVFNNSFVGSGTNNGIGIYVNSTSTINCTVAIENNIVDGMQTNIAVFNSGLINLTSNNNDFFGYGSGTAFSHSGNSSGNFESPSQWAANSLDSKSLFTNPELNALYVPSSTSPAIGSGVNLSAFFKTDAALDSRSASAAWDMGALLPDSGGIVFVVQPLSQNVALGSTVSFLVAAVGTPLPTYQWQKNGANILGATAPTLTLANVSSVSAGTYDAVASNSSGSSVSEGASLTVMTPPAITSQPASQSVSVGANVAFVVSASGNPTPTYRWQKNGAALSDGGDIAGSESSTLSLSDVTSANVGSYVAIATNSIGSTSSNAASLTVASTSTPTPVITSGKSATATVGTAFQYSITATNSPTSYAASGLPPGLSLNLKTGVISGTPTTGGTFLATIMAANSEGTASATLSITVQSAASGPISYVQGAYTTPQTQVATVTQSYPAPQVAGDMNVVVIGWSSPTVQILSVADTKGNVYIPAAATTTLSGLGAQAIYYAKGIASAAAGSNVITVKFHAAVSYPDVRVLEYRGVTAAVGSVSLVGNGASASSGSITTAGKGLLVAGSYVATATTSSGSPFVMRMITKPDADIVEDQITSAAGTYNAKAPVSPVGLWIMQMAAFK
jgi:hypothetical protein